MSRYEVAAFCEESVAKRCAEGIDRLWGEASTVLVRREDVLLKEPIDPRYRWVVTSEVPRWQGQLTRHGAVILAYVRGFADACGWGGVWLR